MRPDKLVLDVNIWVSCILQMRLKDLTAIKLLHELSFFISPLLIAELEDVLNRPKIAKYLSLPVREYIAFIQDLTTLLHPSSVVFASPDPKDNYLFDLALTANASHLVTGDKPLLALVEVEGIRVISFREFREMFEM